LAQPLVAIRRGRGHQAKAVRGNSKSARTTICTSGVRLYAMLFLCQHLCFSNSRLRPKISCYRVTSGAPPRADNYWEKLWFGEGLRENSEFV